MSALIRLLRRPPNRRTPRNDNHSEHSDVYSGHSGRHQIMFNKLKQFKELRSQAKTMQNALKEEKVEVEKSGIKIVMDGNQEVMSYEIDSSLMSPERKHDLENKLKEATNAAIEKTKRVMADKMKSMGGLDALGLNK
jgi:DNA-binding protein YbaB